MLPKKKKKKPWLSDHCYYLLVLVSSSIEYHRGGLGWLLLYGSFPKSNWHGIDVQSVSECVYMSFCVSMCIIFVFSRDVFCAEGHGNIGLYKNILYNGRLAAAENFVEKDPTKRKYNKKNAWAIYSNNNNNNNIVSINPYIYILYLDKKKEKTHPLCFYIWIGLRY